MSKRASNIELLRILAMLGILFGHGVGFVNGLHGKSDIQEDAFSSVFLIVFSCVFVGGVNLFILISGWFGIRSSVKGLLKLLFQFFFLLWGGVAILLLTGDISVGQLTMKNCLGLTDGYWFVMAYIGLYILSPVLNTYAEHATKRQQQMVLIAFYAHLCYYSWVTAYVNYFGGYSIVLFVGLYLTARYFRRFPVKFIIAHSWSLYVCLTACVAAVMLASLYFFGNAGRMGRYDNPIVIAAGICLLLSFQKWQFRSKIVNWLAASCFAVYIIHFHPYVFGHFMEGAWSIRGAFSGFGYFIAVSLYLAAVYLACVCVDQIRVFVWRRWMLRLFS